MRVEEIVFPPAEVGGAAVLVRLPHPLPFDAPVEAFDRSVMGQQIAAAGLADAAELDRIGGPLASLNGVRKDGGKHRQGSKQGEAGFHVVVSVFGGTAMLVSKQIIMADTGIIVDKFHYSSK